MDFYHRASVNSDMHLVKKSYDSIQLMPIDNSQEAIERFQEIAREAFEQEGYGFKIILEHKSSILCRGPLRQSHIAAYGLKQSRKQMNEAVKGEQALAAAVRQRPDLIHPASGHGRLRGARRIKSPALPSIPISAITSYAMSASAN